MALVARILSAIIFYTLLTNSTTVKGIPFLDLRDATLDDLQRGLESGFFTSLELTQTYIARIEQTNHLVHAVTEVNPDALDIARSLDEQRRNGTIKGPLHGIPILLKDNIATADKMNNTAGSLALVGATVPRDSFVAARLRASGAILLGKTSLGQWASMRSFDISSGWSSYGGQSLAAYHALQDPSRSSSGSGVAADLGFAFASLGTETDGSIVNPSHRSNVVGIKPTVGLTSRDLVIPISERQDTVGPIAGSVRDAAVVLQLIAGVDVNDNYTSAIPDVPDYVAACHVRALVGARIGVPWNVVELLKTPALAPEIEAFRSALEVLSSAGATIIDADFSMAEEAMADKGQGVVLNADFMANIASYLAQLAFNPHGVHTLADIRAFTHRTPEERWPEYGTDVWDEALDVQGWDNTDPRFWPVYQRNLVLAGEGGLLGAVERHNLDAVVLPTSMASRWASTSGAPIVTVPMGFHPVGAEVTYHRRGNLVDTGPMVPFGLSFLGKRWSEEALIGLAYGYEQRTMVRRQGRPLVKPSAEVGTLRGSEGDNEAAESERLEAYVTGVSDSVTGGYLGHAAIGSGEWFTR